MFIPRSLAHILACAGVSLSLSGAVAAGNVAFAVEPAVTFQLACSPPADKVDQVICTNAALRAAFRTAVQGLEERGRFFYKDTEDGYVALAGEFASQRRSWTGICGMENVGPERPASGETVSCLIDALWAVHVDARCPVIIRLDGVPTPEVQSALFQHNRAFCEKEIAEYYAMNE